MTVLDVSNYDEWTFDAECMVANGVKAIILGCQREAVADRMAAKAKAAGLPIMATYAFLYFGLDTEGQTAAAIRISQKYGIPRVFLDCESNETTEKSGISPIERVGELRTCVAMVEDAGLAAGIYTGAFWWPSMMGNTTLFAHLPLWHAAYYNDGSKQQAVNYGGWTECAIHQWTSTLEVCGRRRDANVVWDTSLLEDEVSQKDFEDLVLATFSGSEDRGPDGKTLPREERLPIALDRMRNRADGGFGSVADRAESAYVIAQQGGGGKHSHPATIGENA